MYRYLCIWNTLSNIYIIRGVIMGKIIIFTKDKRGITMATIFDVAAYFLHKLREEEDSSITPLKLQKLCYYAQAWSLVWDDEALFKENFQAWAHGPVNPELYDKYREYKWRSIEPVLDLDTSIFRDCQLETMDIIWQDYGIYDGKYLEKLTHQEAPWINVRKGCEEGDYCDEIISKESMKVFYTRMYDEDFNGKN